MAFFNFYINSGGGGSDMNAGNTTGAVLVTSTNGDWSNAVANRFTAAAGTPFSGVVAGDYASIYVDGTTTGAVYIAKVNTVNGGGASIDLDTTLKYGTAPSASATARSCRVNGSWIGETALVQLGSATIPQSTKVNWKQATYTITASRIVALIGTTALPLWISGYNTTPGDLDNDTTNSLTKPTIAFNATFNLTINGAHNIWSGFNFTGNRSGAVVTLAGTAVRAHRCRTENTSSNTAAVAWQSTTTGQHVFSYCWGKCPTTATTNGVFDINDPSLCIGCVAEGGGVAGFACRNSGTIAVLLQQCISLNSAGDAFGMRGPSSFQIHNCTAYTPTSDGVELTTAPTSTVQGSAITGCLFVSCGGFGINFSVGTNTNVIFRACNDFYNTTAENGMGDSPSFFGKTESSSPVTSSTDMTPVVGSNARSNGFPGIFENQSYSSYPDIGAVRHADPVSTGGGGGVAIFGA